ncbi:MAG: recombinase family protein [Enterococcus faecium]|uniref:recombinase family protein n=1 Tax=Enterococcus faecium TaxID=1352 RepID=UPI000CF0F031|nr:recombinase family protein [Enterococcus faecium]EGP5401528.1 recombinase family protein [Enterococcus faecium]EGP5632285.1 recombinase family protein [Enterococcus faecium]MBS6011683.1 recombinase family protein [Enterococcus faecium]PQC80291.1 resolvase [Enterococcus faecium]
MTRTIGYIRTSKNTQDLGLEVQRKALERFEPDELFSEQISGRKENRTELEKALNCLEKGDTLLIYNLSRLSRSSKQLVNLMSELNQKGIHLKSVQEAIDTSSATGRLFYTVLAAIAEFEAESISIRTKEALANSDKQLGRPPIKESKRKKIVVLYKGNHLSLKEIAEKCGVSEKTVYNIAKKEGLSRK